MFVWGFFPFTGTGWTDRRTDEEGNQPPHHGKLLQQSSDTYCLVLQLHPYARKIELSGKHREVNDQLLSEASLTSLLQTASPDASVRPARRARPFATSSARAPGPGPRLPPRTASTGRRSPEPAAAAAGGRAGGIPGGCPAVAASPPRVPLCFPRRQRQGRSGREVSLRAASSAPAALQAFGRGEVVRRNADAGVRLPYRRPGRRPSR